MLFHVVLISGGCSAGFRCRFCRTAVRRDSSVCQGDDKAAAVVTGNGVDRIFRQGNRCGAAGICGNVVDCVRLYAVRICQPAGFHGVIPEIVQVFLQTEVVFVHDRRMDFAHIPEVVRGVGCAGGFCLVAGIPQNEAVFPRVRHHPLIAFGDVGNNFAGAGDQTNVKAVAAAAVRENIGINGGAAQCGVQRAVNL